MFDHKSKNPMITKGQVHQLIMEFGETPNADIQYKEGYLDADGNFVSLGVNKLHIQDREEQKDKDGNITQEASSDYSDLRAMIADTTDLESDLEKFLVERL